MTDVHASLEEYRGTREALEAALLPLATSVDGRRFTHQKCDLQASSMPEEGLEPPTRGL